MNARPDAEDAGAVRIGDALPVWRMGFGAMRLCGEGVWGPPRDPANARRVLERAIELGVNFIDTAEAYGPHVNEEQIADALFPYPDDLLIATKGGSTRSGPSAWGRDGRPETLRKNCEGSLQRLRLAQIDLYQLHAVDPKVPIEESVGALAELQQEGKIFYIGVSNVDVEQLARARSVATIVSVQNRYNVADRHSEEVLKVCERDGLGFLPWFPLNAGEIAEHEPLARAARDHDATPHQIALAWLLQRSPNIVVIPGTSSLAHLEENVAAASIRLTDEERAALPG